MKGFSTKVFALRQIKEIGLMVLGFTATLSMFFAVRHLLKNGGPAAGALAGLLFGAFMAPPRAYLQMVWLLDDADTRDEELAVYKLTAKHIAVEVSFWVVIILGLKMFLLRHHYGF